MYKNPKTKSLFSEVVIFFKKSGDKMQYYRCFSWKQKEFLKEHGFQYEFKARHIGNGKVFYFYFWSYQLDLCLREYSEIKRIELDLKKRF